MTTEAATTTVTLTIAEIVARYQPESHPHEQETWDEIGDRLWRDEWAYMTAMRWRMHYYGWIAGTEGVTVHDGHVQNGHHRIVTALGLRMGDLAVPVEIRPVTE